jgi:hypothetical protein
MKKQLMLGLFLIMTLVIKGQGLTYEFTYDNAGNRVSRSVIQLSSKSGGDESPKPITEVMGNGVTMELFPNPTKGSIRFQTSEHCSIDGYVLTDVAGRVIAKSSCEGASLVIDFFGQPAGIYLLKILIDKKPYLYKVIKQ